MTFAWIGFPTLAPCSTLQQGESSLVKVGLWQASKTTSSSAPIFRAESRAALSAVVGERRGSRKRPELHHLPASRKSPKRHLGCSSSARLERTPRCDWRSHPSSPTFPSLRAFVHTLRQPVIRHWMPEVPTSPNVAHEVIPSALVVLTPSPQ